MARPRGGEPGGPERVIVIEGIGPVRFEKSRRARHVRITVRASEGVRVIVPERVSFEGARPVAVRRKEWIRRTLGRIDGARDRCREAVLAAEGLDRRHAREYLTARLSALAKEHGFSHGRLSVRAQTTLWGSASVNDRIQLNALLAILPQDLSDYVILHELVHTRHRGHGRGFWRELERCMPDARRRQALLREYSLALF